MRSTLLAAILAALASTAWAAPVDFTVSWNQPPPEALAVTVYVQHNHRFVCIPQTLPPWFTSRDCRFNARPGDVFRVVVTFEYPSSQESSSITYVHGVPSGIDIEVAP